MFEPVQSRVNSPELEQGIIRFWQERRVFERSVEQRADGDLFILYEGPPTANASPGVHHILSRVFKDVIPRYKAMKGFRAPRKAGWDTHGLPVELSIEKELGFSSKEDIETYGVAEFNRHCRDSVFRYVEEWNRLTERIGFWVDMEKAYRTLEPSYIESCWWIIKQLWDKGLIYQGYKVTPHCPRCGTSLSSHEVALGWATRRIPPTRRFTSSSRSTLTQSRGHRSKTPSRGPIRPPNRPICWRGPPRHGPCRAIQLWR